MLVRLAFAVAAHLEPEILLVDEVLAVGDVAFQKKCLGKMQHVASEGRTVLFVSHNMVAVEGLCSRGIMLRTGQLMLASGVRDTINHYMQNLESQRVVPLEDRKDREGNGKVKLIDLKIIDRLGCETQSVDMGEGFTVELQTVGKLTKAIIGVLIGNAHRVQMLRGYTWENLSDDVDLSGRDIIKCHFEDFPMMHGAYNIHVWIAQRLGDRNELVDYVENAAPLQIRPKDIYGNGRLLDPAGGIAFCETKWEIEPR